MGGSHSGVGPILGGGSQCVAGSHFGGGVPFWGGPHFGGGSHFGGGPILGGVSHTCSVLEMRALLASLICVCLTRPLPALPRWPRLKPRSSW